MRWRFWFVTFKERIKTENGWMRSIMPHQVRVLARDEREALRLAFQRAPSSTLRPTENSTGALWGQASPQVGA